VINEERNPDILCMFSVGGIEGEHSVGLFDKRTKITEKILSLGGRINYGSFSKNNFVPNWSFSVVFTGDKFREEQKKYIEELVFFLVKDSFINKTSFGFNFMELKI